MKFSWLWLSGFNETKKRKASWKYPFHRRTINSYLPCKKCFRITKSPYPVTSHWLTINEITEISDTNDSILNIPLNVKFKKMILQE